MRRIVVPERQGWKARVKDLGLTYEDQDGVPYWTDGAYYEFDQKQIEILESATAEIHLMCLAVVEEVVSRGRWAELAISPEFASVIERSWRAQDPFVYGRMDFAWNGTGAPKLLEYNSDTPTSLIEASVIQWDWMTQRIEQGVLGEHIDQFNALDTALVNAWRRASRAPGMDRLTKLQPLMISSYSDFPEDYQTALYMAACANEAGIPTTTIDPDGIGWDDRLKRFVDLIGLPIQAVWKLYPWEHMAVDEFAPRLNEEHGTRFIEPAWKSILSNKGMLAILWEMFPGHENLLETSFSPRPFYGRAHVRKPLFSREGANVDIHLPDEAFGWTETLGGQYGAEGHVWQEYIELPRFDGRHAIIGSWVAGANPRFEGLPVLPLGCDPCGIGIREHGGLITGNLSRIVPHVFVPDPENPPIPVPEDRYVP